MIILFIAYTFFLCIAMSLIVECFTTKYRITKCITVTKYSKSEVIKYKSTENQGKFAFYAILKD